MLFEKLILAWRFKTAVIDFMAESEMIRAGDKLGKPEHAEKGA